MKNLYELCPSFETCSANKCPLDLLKKQRDHKLDEPQCQAQKRTIRRIRQQKPLKSAKI